MPGHAQLAVDLEALAEPEVGEVRPGVAVEDDVRRLEVAMDDAHLVGVVDGVGDRLEDLDGLAQAQAALALDAGLEVGSVDQAHRDEQDAVGLARGVDRARCSGAPAPRGSPSPRGIACGRCRSRRGPRG